jgi:pimeloyl-ACP methyl ester carboxylesterase
VSDHDGIEEFRIAFAPQAVADLRRRIRTTRMPMAMPGSGWAYGMDYDVLRTILDHWGNGYSWPDAEAWLNRFRHFRTRIDGLDIHFVHARSRHEDATPVLMLHGWPGSFVEFLDVADRLTRPEDYGGDPSTALHLVIPSLPGFGLSGQPQTPGWDVARTARAFSHLMSRLGYARYGVQGGDFGAIVLGEMGIQDTGAILGLHTNMAVAEPPQDAVALDAREQADVAAMAEWRDTERAYAVLQSTKPHTIGIALNDSPAGLCAWIGEKFHGWTDLRGAAFSPIALDRILTNITLYWLTGTAHSAARFYYEYYHAVPFTRKGPIAVPTCVARFPAEIIKPPRAWIERQYNVVRWTDFDRGGHFAAMEVPDAFAADVRTFFRDLRARHGERPSR